MIQNGWKESFSSFRSMAARGTLFALCLLCCTISFVLGARRDHGTVEWMGSDSSMECTSNHNYRSTALSGSFGCSEYSPLTLTTWVLQAQSETMQLVFDFVSFNTVNGTLKIYDGISVWMCKTMQLIQTQATIPQGSFVEAFLVLCFLLLWYPIAT